jgi:murein DD-endopeptidase MepM/ murein hydrolase activator NlpD
MTLCTSNRLIGQLAVASLSAFAAGCSADVARFDSPSFSLNGSSSTASLPKPAESVRPSSGKSALGGDRNDSGTMDSGAYIPPPRRDARDSGIQVANLPEAKGAASPPPAAAAPVGEPPRRPGQSAQPAPAYTPPPAPQASAAPSGARGEQIGVQHGDTLYGISKKYKVSLNELLQVNGLTNPNLKPGQKLYLPAGKGARKPLTKGETAAISPVGGPVSAAAPTGAVPAAPADIASWNGTYTVKAGDSLYAVSRQYKVKLADLQGANGIADVRKVKPGTVLKVPGSGGGATTASLPPATGAAAAATAAEPVAAAPVQPATSTRPTIINGDKTAAVAPKTDTPAQAAATAEPAQSVASSGKLRWPVKGRVIATFGARPDGTNNDGVNLAVPMGTEVHAAESGVVAYAGNELKGYGNLVLIRHDNGWVTAYAHNDEISVKRGDKVKRGQAIAKAGKSGQVDQPQVHFELRQGAKPVDPTPFMERL